MNEQLSQNEGVREVVKQLCKRLGKIKERNAEKRKYMNGNVEVVGMYG